MKKIFKILFVATLVLLAFSLILRIWAKVRFKPFQYSTVEEIPSETPPRIALVLGAGIWRGNILSPAAMDRIKAGAELYQSGKIKKIILSGDNREVHYNEPEAMKKGILELGVPEEALVLDYAGRHTYDSCYRAR